MVGPTEQVADPAGADGRPAPRSERQLLAIIVLLGIAAFGLAARLRLLHGSPWGDEPAYLVLSQAMQLYHSLDVTQVYANKDYLSFYPGQLDAHVVTGADGRALPFHQFGGPLLWLLPFALWGRAGAIIFMVIVSVLCLVNVYFFLRERGIDAVYAFVVTLCMAVGSPIYVYASMSFVEPIGALGVIFAVRAILVDSLGLRRLALAAAGVAFLPWVHMRFAPLAVSLGALLIWRIWRDHGRNSVWPYILCVAPLALSVVLIEVFTLSVYGETNPMAPQGIYGVEVFANPFHEGIAGTLFDRNFGLIVNFPIFLLVLPGVLLALGRVHARVNLVLLAVIAPYLALSCTSTAWWGSYNPPARYAEVVVPLLSFYIAVVLQRINSWLATCAAILSAMAGYALALPSDIFPSERFTALDLRNHPMERLGDLVGFSIVRYPPSSFLPGQRGLFASWWIATLAVGLALWLAGNPAMPRWNRLVATLRHRLPRIGVAIAVAISVVLLTMLLARSHLTGGPSLAVADVVGTWRSTEGGELTFYDDGRFTASTLRRDVVTPTPPGSSAGRHTEPRRSASGDWKLDGDTVALKLLTVDDAAAGTIMRLRSTVQGGAHALVFLIVAPDLNIRYVFVRADA